MHREIEKVWAVHRVDARLLALNAALAKLDNGAGAQAALAKAEGELARQRDSLNSARVALNEAEVSLKANESRSENLKKRLYGGLISKQAEVEAVEHEIADLKKKAGELEDTILGKLDAIAEAEKSVKAQEELVARWKERLSSVLEAYTRASGVVNEQILEATQQRSAALAEAPATVMHTYEAIRKRTKSTGMARLVEGSCEGCHMQIASFTVQRLVNTSELTVCENCGRLLYKES